MSQPGGDGPTDPRGDLGAGSPTDRRGRPTTGGTPPPADPLVDAARLVATVAVLGIAFALALAFVLNFAAPVAAFATGLLIGATEIIGRYRDRPSAALMTIPGLFYMALNGLVSLGAYHLVATGQLGGVPTAPFANPTLNSLLLGAFGGMALLRTSLLNVRVRDTEVSVGPAAILEVVLRAADRAVDRERAGPRATEVAQIMRGIPFAKASRDLLVHCSALLQNFSAEERSQLNEAMQRLAQDTDLDDGAKSAAAGLLIMGVVGPDVLQRAVETLGPGMRAADQKLEAIIAADAHIVGQIPLLRAVIGQCVAFDPDPTAQKRAEDIWNRIDRAESPFTFAAPGPLLGAIAIAELAKVFGTQIVSKAVSTVRDRVKAPEVIPPSRPTGDEAAGTP